MQPRHILTFPAQPRSRSTYIDSLDVGWGLAGRSFNFTTSTLFLLDPFATWRLLGLSDRCVIYDNDNDAIP